MLRRGAMATAALLLQPHTPTANVPNTLHLSSAASLLRLIYRCIDIHIPSNQGRKFLKRRLIEQWRSGREVRDPQRQRMLMERAGAMLQILNTTERAPKLEKNVVHWQLSRVEAHARKEEMKKMKEETDQSQPQPQ